MSLLADMLSKVKQSEPKREVPPNLKSIVEGAKKEPSSKRKYIILSLVLGVVIIGGFALTYVVSQLAGSNESNITVADSSFDSDDQVLPDVPVGPSAEAVSDNVIPPAEKIIEPLPLPAAEIASPNETNIKKVELKKLPEQVLIEEAPVITVSDDSGDIELAGQEKKALPAVKESAEVLAALQKDTLLYSARESEKRGQYAEALASYKKLLEITGGDIAALNNVAFIYLTLGLPEQAAAYARKALEIKPDHVPSLINMGISLARAGQTEEAEKMLLQAAAAEPENEHALMNLSLLYEGQDRRQEASKYYTTLIALGNVRGSLGMARIYETGGETAKALKMYGNIYEMENVEREIMTMARQRMRTIINNRREGEK
ncbi:MAG: tetratricopeptide repeat protein [Nitrospira sp.]|nr:tetratricopeptide repeat protein [bacterium]MBL7049226.1 tetratricopeptide repeat protein [Nitrospira sp.]